MFLPAGLLGLAASLAPLPSAAQIIDDIELRREGSDAVLAVRFATEVRFQRSVTTRSGDLTQVAYLLLTETNTRLGTPIQVRRLPATNALPEIEIADEPVRTERGDQSRRLVVRSATPMAIRPRAGRDSRSIDIVLPGKAGAVPPQPARAPATQPKPPLAAAAPAPAPTASVPAAPPTESSSEPPLTSTAAPAVEKQAAELMRMGRQAFDAGRWSEAAESFGQALELPPHSGSREAQLKVGLARLRQQDLARAIAELETFLRLYPKGEDSDLARAQLASIAKPAVAPETAETTRPKSDSSTTGSTSATYYGGNGQVRSRDFQDSPISGLPQVAGEPQLSNDRSRQLYTDVDLNWRRRTAEVDQRFVFRDAYISDLLRPDKSRNRLSALYFDHRSLTGRWGARLGRQSPTGGGVMSRYDGVSGHWNVQPRIKLGAVAGAPTEKVFDSNRRFHGLSVDFDRLPGGFGAGFYGIEQRIDGYVDRRAVGMDLRWFQSGATVFSQLDYDLAIGAVNIAAIQGTYITSGNTVFNALFDRRALTTLALGNALTFDDPANPGSLSRTIAQRLSTSTLESLRSQIKRITPMLTQAQLGVTVPLNKNWQVASSLQLTNTGAIPPVPEVAGFEKGRPATGDIVTASAQLIGLNLYSARDTHVMSVTRIQSPVSKGLLLGYNNSSQVWSDWSLEPSLQFYSDRLDAGTTNRRWTPGLRLTYRGIQRWALESSLTMEFGKTRRVTLDPSQVGVTITTEESTHRVNYSLGARYEF